MMDNVNGRSIEKIYLCQCGRFITGIGSLSPLLRVKIVHLVDRSDLFKSSNLVYDGRKL